MSYTLTTAPSAEPLTLAEVKTFCQVEADVTADDELIANVLIPAARQACEHLTGRALITQQWRRTLDSFGCGPIDLEHAPLASVESVQYLDSAGAWQTADAALYTVDTASQPGRVALAFGQVWPQVQYQIASVRINYTAGYGATGSAVPESLKHWMLMRIRGMYELRGESVEVMRGQLAKPGFVDGLLDAYRVVGH